MITSEHLLQDSISDDFDITLTFIIDFKQYPICIRWTLIFLVHEFISIFLSFVRWQKFDICFFIIWVHIVLFLDYSKLIEFIKIFVSFIYFVNVLRECRFESEVHVTKEEAKIACWVRINTLGTNHLLGTWSKVLLYFCCHVISLDHIFGATEQMTTYKAELLVKQGKL